MASQSSNGEQKMNSQKTAELNAERIAAASVGWKTALNRFGYEVKGHCIVNIETGDELVADLPDFGEEYTGGGRIGRGYRNGKIYATVGGYGDKKRFRMKGDGTLRTVDIAKCVIDKALKRQKNNEEREERATARRDNRAAGERLIKKHNLSNWGRTQLNVHSSEGLSIKVDRLTEDQADQLMTFLDGMGVLPHKS